MQLQHPLRVITPTVDGDVLTVLAGATTSFTSGDVLRLASGSWSRSGIRKSLDRLAAQGIVDVVKVGAGYAFSLNRDHLAAPYVVGIAHLRAELLDRLSAALREEAPGPPRWAALFGSAARAQMTLTSDIDIFVVPSDDVDPDVWADWSAGFSSSVSRWTGNDARLLEMSTAEVARSVTSGDPILTSVARDAVPLLGDPRWLHRQLRQTS